MNRYFTFIILFLHCNIFCNAQYAILQDKDGFVNLREEGKKGSKIINKLKSGTIVYALEPASANWDWTTIIYNGEETGVVFYDRLKFIVDYSEFKKTTEKPDELILKLNAFQITIQTQKFDPKKNKLTKKDEFISQINGKNIWGTDGMMPQTEYKKISIMLGNKQVNLPEAEYKNMYNPNLESTFANYDKASEKLYITMQNSEGAGSYAAIFVFQNGKFLEKQVVIPF